jgi:hypothetical protein
VLDTTRYPNFNDRPHDRPVISSAGHSLLGELVWLIAPAIVIILALLVR